MDRLDELAILVAIAEAGSLAGAARRLRRSPPAVTRALASAEARFGAQLFYRTTRRLAPTDAAAALIDRAKILLQDYAGLMAGGTGAPVSGLLRVTAPVQFGRRHVAPIVTAFLDAFPETQVELILNDRNLDLVEERLDLAVRIGPLKDSALRIRRVGTVRRLLVASPAYLARHGEPRQTADLSAHETIVGTAHATSHAWRFGSGGRAGTVRLSPRLIVNDVEAMIHAAKAGRGIARPLSYQVVDELRDGTLVRLLPEAEPPPLPVQLVTQVHAPSATRLGAFLDFAAERLRALPVLRE